jgi:hypothetical protein
MGSTRSARPTVKLQDPEVRAELNRRIRECERKFSTGGRLGSILQACARARQRDTREQIKGQWYKSRNSVQEMQPGTAIMQEATRVCRPCFYSTHA